MGKKLRQWLAQMDGGRCLDCDWCMLGQKLWDKASKNMRPSRRRTNYMRHSQYIRKLLDVRCGGKHTTENSCQTCEHYTKPADIPHCGSRLESSSQQRVFVSRQNNQLHIWHAMSHAQSLLFPCLTSTAHSTRTPIQTSLLFP